MNKLLIFLFTNRLFHVFAQRKTMTPSLRSIEQLFNFLELHNWDFEKFDVVTSRRPDLSSDAELPQKGQVSIYIGSDKKSSETVKRNHFFYAPLSPRRFAICP